MTNKETVKLRYPDACPGADVDEEFDGEEHWYIDAGSKRLAEDCPSEEAAWAQAAAQIQERAVRTGDVVQYIPTGERWRVAAVDGQHLYACGMLLTRVETKDCEIITRCTDEDHMSYVQEIAAAEGSDPRITLCKELLK